MKIIISILLFLLLGTRVEAQETTLLSPKVGRYVQNAKETKVRYNDQLYDNYVIYQLTSVDVLNEKEMRINFLIGNNENKQCLIKRQSITENPFYIIDENYIKHKPLSDLKADWNEHTVYENPYYVLAPTEKVQGYIVFPTIKGAKKFDLYFGYEAQPIKNIQCIE